MADDSNTNSERDLLLSQFCSITAVETERARLYLESAGWSIDLATRSFFEEQEEEAVGETGEQQRQQINLQETTEDLEDCSPPAYKMSEDKDDKQKRFATISSLNKDEQASDEEEGQAFYAGGSETSGQQMLGPARKKTDSDALISNTFKMAKEHGAQVIDKSDFLEKQRKKNLFTGHGHRLGAEDEPSNASTSSSALFEPPVQTEGVDIGLKMWRNGFSIDDGPLRAYDDPESRTFLNSIMRGELPTELTQNAKGKEISVNMEDHRHEEYTPPRKISKPFSGSGFRLGSAAPSVESTSTAAATTISSNADLNNVNFEVDETRPTTNIQVRLADGTRLVLKVNLTNTVKEIKDHISKVRPNIRFKLMTSFPRKELTDDSLTVEAAQLANAVIMQTLE